MRVAILSESSADEAALRILVDAVLGIATAAPVEFSLQSRGWPSVRNVIPVVARRLHYQDGADGLVVVADSNHKSVIADSADSRLHELQGVVNLLQKGLKPLGCRPPLKIVVGIASPAIEAWLLCCQHGNISEAQWEQGLANKRDPYSKLGLKRLLYGSDKPTLAMETARMIETAHQAALNISNIESRFPMGFGSMCKALRFWRRF